MEKYPRTFHLSFSPEVHSDDKTINEAFEEFLLSQEIVITVKLDGGNCCIKPNVGVFARSHSQPTDHSTFDYIKNMHFHAKNHILNPKYHYFGENMYGIHSIEYDGLDDYFYIFNILDTETDEWLSWDEVVVEAERCNYKVVPLLFNGSSDAKNIRKLIEKSQGNSWLGATAEGFVVRLKKRIKASDFSQFVAKFVRQGHVQTDDHWSMNWRPAKLLK